MCLHRRVSKQFGSFQYRGFVPFRFGYVPCLQSCKAHPSDADAWKQLSDGTPVLPNTWQDASLPMFAAKLSEKHTTLADNFGSFGNDLSMWKFYNLLTGANKSSYIDSFLDRAYNATEIAAGINEALHGDERYSWFID